MVRVEERWGRCLAIAATWALGVSLSACSTDRLPMPPDDATPEQIVQAYAKAVHTGDCGAAMALVEDRQESWCGNTDILALKVTDRTQERRQTEAGDGPMIERVWVRMSGRNGDASLPEGDYMWSYLLDRTGPNAAWRIYDQGMG